MTCRDVTQLVSQALDRKPPLGQRLWVGLHLFLCRDCARFRRQLLFLTEAVRHYVAAGRGPGLLTSARLSPEARDRIQRSLRDESP